MTNGGGAKAEGKLRLQGLERRDDGEGGEGNEVGEEFVDGCEASEESGPEGTEGGGSDERERKRKDVNDEGGSDRAVPLLHKMKVELERLSEAEAERGARLDGLVEEMAGVAGLKDDVERMCDLVRTYLADLSRRNRGLGGGAIKWAVLWFLVITTPSVLLAGAFVGQRWGWEVLPVEDSTRGWRDHVWESYGGDVIGCVRRGLRDGSSFECVIDVRGSVEEVRARGSGQ